MLRLHLISFNISVFFFNSYFNHPDPMVNIILEEVGRLHVALAQSLKCPRTRQTLTVEFRGDVFSCLFKGKGEKCLTKVTFITDSSQISGNNY